MASSPKRNKLEDCKNDEIPSSQESECASHVSLDLEQLDVYQTELDEIEDEMRIDMATVESKYALRKHEIYQKRSNIIKLIPNFWTLTLPNHPDIAPMLDEDTKNILHYLRDIVVDSEKDGFKIHFVFDVNHFFHNTTITKEYRIISRRGSDCNFEIIPASIAWKTGKEMSPGSNSSKTLFCWLQTDTDKDLQIAECFRYDIFANPLLYYLLKDTDNSGESSDDGDTVELDDVLIVESDDEQDQDVFEVDNSSSSSEGLFNEDNGDDDTKN